MRPAAAGSAGSSGRGRRAVVALGVAAFAATPTSDSLAGGPGQVMLRPAAGTERTVVQVTGRGFATWRRVTVATGRRRLAVRTSGNRGRFTARVRIPANRQRERQLVSLGGRQRVVNTFRIDKDRANVGEVASSTGHRVRWRPLAASPGATITLRGSGFKPSQRLRVSLAQRTKRPRATRRGSFAVTMTAPARAGSHVGTVRTHGRSLRLVVGVELGPAMPGPFPWPILPFGAEPVIAGAGDIATSSLGAETTAKLLDEIDPDVVYTTGDNAYPDGAAADFARFYEPTWGRHRTRTLPTPGNHDYHQPGAGPYFDYFGPLAGERGSGYYAHSLGAWRVYALNSNIAMDAGSPQETWLRLDLAANPHACVLALWHHPRFSAGEYSDDTKSEAIWRTLYDARAEVVLNGHDHNYQRYAPMSPAGAVEQETGIREFVVGTGGQDGYQLTARPDGTRETGDDQTTGVLKLTLLRHGYAWQFVPEPGKTFTDRGSDVCH